MHIPYRQHILKRGISRFINFTEEAQRWFCVTYDKCLER